MDRIAIFPGSFDPITKGHESVIKRALPLFEKIYVSIGTNTTKNNFFSLEKRINMIKHVFRNDPKIIVESYEGLTIDYLKEKNVTYILRGLRTSADFEYERAIAQMNKMMNNKLETVFLLTTPELTAINSTVVREILRYNGDVTAFVPNDIIDMVKTTK